jgi:hypothetical protein
MSKTKILFNRIFSLLSIVLLVSCGVAYSPGLSEEITVTVTADYYKELATYHVSIPVKNTANLSNEEIVKDLFSAWMEHFKSQDIDKRIQLNDFAIQDIQFPADLKKCSTDLGVEALVQVTYSYQTITYPAPDWNSFGNGELGENNWVNNNSLILGLFIDDHQYSFRILGAPPCAGIAIDGAKINQE